MTNPNDGGPAHPVTLENGYVIRGMTVWDRFFEKMCMAIVQGCISSDGSFPSEIEVVTEAREYADAMLAERARRMEANSE